MKILSIAAAIAVGTLFTGCAAHTNLLPLGKGNWSPNVGVGGPIVEAFEMHVPIPYLTVGTDFGISDKVNLNADVHLLPLAYSIAGLDLGAAWFPFEQKGWMPTLGIGPRLFAFASTKQGVEDRFLFYPALSGSAAWKAGTGLLYAGADLAIPLTRPNYDKEAKTVIFSPYTGYRWNVGRGYALLTELKWHGANIVTDKIVTGYTSIGKQGALTPLFAIQRKF